MQTTFNEMRLLKTADVLADFSSHNKHFDVYTDYQMGVCMVQDSCRIIYCSKGFNYSYWNYMMVEKDMLSMVATLKGVGLCNLYTCLPIIKVNIC